MARLADGLCAEFIAIFVVSCLHVRFVCEFSKFSGWRGRRARVLSVNFRSFQLVNFFDVHFRGNSRAFRCSAVLLKGSKTGFV